MSNIDSNHNPQRQVHQEGEKKCLKGASDQMTQNSHVIHFPDTLSHLKSGAILPWNNC